MRRLLKKLFGGEVKTRVNRHEEARQELSDHTKDQFKKLKEKGLSIPIFNL